MENTAANEIEKEVKRNYRWNFTVNAMDGASFWFGMSFISGTVILPLFVSHFTQSTLLIGLIAFLSSAGYLLPQMFSANLIERAPRKKFFAVNMGFFLERIPLLLLAPMTLLLATRKPMLALTFFFVLYAWHTLGAGTIVVAWQDMIAKIIPVDRRGRFFGITNFTGYAAGILGALAVPFMLERWAFPTGYVTAFAIAGAFVLLSWVFLSLTREPAVPNNKPPVSQLDYLRSLPEVLRRDRNFRTYLTSQVVFSLSGMAMGFLVVYAVRRWDLPDATASGFTIALQIGLALANLFFGFLGDRKGHKLNLGITMVLSIVSVGLAILAPSPAWFYAIFFLRGVVSAGLFVSGISIVYEFTDADNRATYIGLANTLPGIAGAIAPLIGGWLAGAVSYPAMFMLSTVIGAAAWAMLQFAVREPRHASRGAGAVNETMVAGE